MKPGNGITCISKIFRNRIIHHVLFWLLSFYVLLNLFSSSSELYKVDYLYTLIFLFTLLIVVYINLLLLVPKLLRFKKYFLYGIILLIILFAGSLFNVLLFSRFIDFLLPGYYFISYYSFFDIVKFFSVFLFITTLLKLSKEWFQLIESKQKLVETEKEKVEIELKALRSQVNPHFLFNSLNVLYALALKKAKETPEAIIKLSDILRYVIYDSNTDKVKVSSEVILIQNYLDLQNHRIDNTSNVVFETDIQDDLQIPPLLFLPLVENSFKHGIKADVSDTYVLIKLRSKGQEVIFEIENNKGVTDKIEKKLKHGIGIANIKQRLLLLYPHNHVFSISENEKIFKVFLKIRNEN
ncbi:MAG: histidine kinase [Bacteroidales bacterium]|nr:histidine kinase [Bacteroidales bacterium]